MTKAPALPKESGGFDHAMRFTPTSVGTVRVLSMEKDP